MKINLPVFKDKDKKDAITYQSCHWNLMVYHHAGCQDCTLLPCVIFSLQGYPWELVGSSGTDVTLDGILIVLDEYYNNVKALDALNQKSSNCEWVRRRLCQSGGASVEASPNYHGFVPRTLSTRSCNFELRCDHFYMGAA